MFHPASRRPHAHPLQHSEPHRSPSSRSNAFDEKRNSGHAHSNLGVLCGQAADDPRFVGEPTVTCSDNAARHAGRVDPEAVQQILLQMTRRLLKRRFFESARLFDRWYILLVDGTVQEKCRADFAQDGKASAGQARYGMCSKPNSWDLTNRCFPYCTKRSIYTIRRRTRRIAN